MSGKAAPAAAATAAAPSHARPPPNNNDDDDSFSSDSEDEYLTMRRGVSRDCDTAEGGKNREAMIRKKLLESFYGKSAVDEDDDNAHQTRRISGTDTDSEKSSDDDDDDDYEDGIVGGNKTHDPSRTEDLDSPQFNAAAHTQKHVLSSGVHPLLETEESLACQVRTLDSNLQTLVYENYSRFIEATDAIRSIGVNVQANHENLSQLQNNMNVVSEASRTVETEVGPLRDQVVEKLRVKRLLQRLDTLLKLPTTLREHIQAGKYRLATQSYISAYSILSKHSAGFESLQRIEADCHDIMTQLVQDVRQKLIHWSGGVVPSLQRNHSGGSDSPHSEDYGRDNQGNLGGETKKSMENTGDDYGDVDDEYGPMPDPPQSIIEIMECAGTPALILASQEQHATDDNSHDTNPNLLDPQLTLEDCQEMALNACLRFLERILDTHHIELQEQELVSKMNANSSSTARDSFQDPSVLAEEQGTSGTGTSDFNLVPTTVLDSILEASTLYSMTFVQDPQADASKEDNNAKQASCGRADERLAHFITSAFGNFLQHVRGELLEQAMLQQQQASQARAAAHKAQKDTKSKDGQHKKTQSENAADGEEMLRLAAAEEKAEEESDQYDEHIATAMATLLVSVRQLASGLSMVPKAAIAPELASGLVDQTTGLTEAMVRRRVDQKFFTLRLRVIEDCLAPFCQGVSDLSNADEGTKEEQPPPLLGAVQLASVALSDSLQLVDDTVRSILATLDEDGGNDDTKKRNEEEIDDSMLLEAVEQSTKRFAKWLASAMEMLAGYESSTDPKAMLQAKDICLEDQAGGDDDKLRSASSYGDTAPTAMNKAIHAFSDDMSEMTAENSGDTTVDTALLELLDASKPTQDMVLAIAEVCRVAERSVMDNIHQSITTHSGGGPASNSGAGSAGTKGRKTTSGTRGDDLFAGDESQKHNRAAKNPISQRFRLAASRVLSLFAMNRGHEAATLLCSTLPELAFNANETPSLHGPRPPVGQVLSIVKATSLDCADLFGGKRRAGPIPGRLEDEYASLTASRMTSSRNRSGLVFDVERMFAEKVIVYPHPGEVLDFKRNAVLALLFKVAFKAWCENSRLLRFSVQGYRQFKIDVEFFRWFLPHFIKDETLSDGSNPRNSVTSLLTEVVQTAKDQCVIEGEDLYQDVEETNQARSTIRQYMSGQEGNPSFCIAED